MPFEFELLESLRPSSFRIMNFQSSFICTLNFVSVSARVMCGSLTIGALCPVGCCTWYFSHTDTLIPWSSIPVVSLEVDIVLALSPQAENTSILRVLLLFISLRTLRPLLDIWNSSLPVPQSLLWGLTHVFKTVQDVFNHSFYPGLLPLSSPLLSLWGQTRPLHMLSSTCRNKSELLHRKLWQRKGDKNNTQRKEG